MIKRIGKPKLVELTEEVKGYLAEMQIEDGGKTWYIMVEWLEEADDLLTVEITDMSLMPFLTLQDDDVKYEISRSKGHVFIFSIDEDYEEGIYEDEVDELIEMVLDKVDLEEE